MKKIFLAGMIAGAAGCTGAGDTTSSVLVDAGTVERSEFKMYSEPNTVPDHMCDLFTSLSLVTDGSSSRATLDNGLDGICELAITPNKRTYKLTRKVDGCGAVIYKGKRGNRSITITDNRKNTCEMPIQALIVATEKQGSKSSTIYSLDQQRPTEQPKKFYCDGVGGVDEWTIYVDLNKKKAGFFDNDNTAVVPMTDHKILESLPPQDLYIFQGPDSGGGTDEILRIQFNATTLKASVTFAYGTAEEKTHESENGCVASDDIDLD